MIVTKINTYTSKSNNREYVELHMLDNEDEYSVLSISVQKDKVRNSDKLRKGSVIDLFWKPGYQGRAIVDKVIVSDEVIDIIEFVGKEDS